MEQSIWQELKHRFIHGGVITKLIFVNIIVFILFYGSVSILWLFDNELSYRYSAKLMSLIALPEDPMTLLTRPWTFVTYMFMHDKSLFHIIFNLLFLYWFGNILTNYISNKNVLPIYIYGGLISGLIFVAAFNLFPAFSDVSGRPLIGASGAVFAIVIAAATLAPDHTIHMLFIGAIRLKYIALIVILLQVVTMMGGNAGGNFAHLGGALFGFLYIKQLKNGHDWSKGFNWFMDRLVGVFSFSKKPKIKIVYSDKEKAVGKMWKQSPDQPSHQDQIDRILDKINQSGYESLSKDEKDFLFKASREVKDE